LKKISPQSPYKLQQPSAKAEVLNKQLIDKVLHHSGVPDTRVWIDDTRKDNRKRLWEQFGTELPNRWITLRATKLLKHMDKALVKIRGPAPAYIVYS
jgi:hypothetical protein